MTEYPEHEKLHLIKDQSQKCGEFIEWLSGVRDIHLATWICPHENEDWHEVLADCDSPFLVYAQQHLETLLAAFFGIDLNVLEAEKRQMLDVQRALNERGQEHG